MITNISDEYHLNWDDMYIKYITSKWSSSLSSNLHGRMASASPMAAGYGSSRRSTKSTGSLASGGEKVPPVAVWLGGWVVGVFGPNGVVIKVGCFWLGLYIFFLFDGEFLREVPPKNESSSVVHEELTIRC